jgi:hypothetical protein
MKRDPILAMLAADENLDPALAAFFNLDYTAEELAIEAEERAPQEALERAEREAERPYWRTRGEL